MPLIKHTATSLGQIMSICGEINRSQQGRTWFRGHGSAAYQLVPSVLRDTVPFYDGRGQRLKGGEHLQSSGYTVTGLLPERMLAQFKNKAPPFLEKLPSNDFEWMFLMQHYGVPTRLLDWTTSAQVATYFAVEGLSPNTHTSAEEAASHFLDGQEYRADGFAIYAMDPTAVNAQFHDIDCIVDLATERQWDKYVSPMGTGDLSTYFPLCAQAPHIDRRIQAQSGTFTLHGANIWPLDYYEDVRAILHKIFVPYDHIGSIQDDLIVAGTTTSRIYPDLAGLSREIKVAEMRQHGFDRARWHAAFGREI